MVGDIRVTIVHPVLCKGFPRSYPGSTYDPCTSVDLRLRGEGPGPGGPGPATMQVLSLSRYRGGGALMVESWGPLTALWGRTAETGFVRKPRQKSGHGTLLPIMFSKNI